MKLSEWITNMTTLHPDDPEICAIIWTAKDVHTRAVDNGELLTADEITTVLYRLKRDHDADIGINWTVMDFWIDEVVSQR